MNGPVLMHVKGWFVSRPPIESDRHYLTNCGQEDELKVSVLNCGDATRAATEQSLALRRRNREATRRDEA